MITNLRIAEYTAAIFQIQIVIPRELSVRIFIFPRSITPQGINSVGISISILLGLAVLLDLAGLLGLAGLLVLAGLLGLAELLGLAGLHGLAELLGLAGLLILAGTSWQLMQHS